MNEKKKMTTGKAILIVASFFGGAAVASRLGCKILGEGEKLKNPLEVLGWLSLMGAAGAVSAKATNGAYEGVAAVMEMASDIKGSSVENVEETGTDEEDEA